ncbi:TonB-linked SusC/RagA family outer membrane protein [Chryseobacterium sp. 52]|uniref:SusC/RagA family TonB-linked outer membrane protein n=1 Tax=Chryseobacterium sp. 52 TaxID=2035213 RepID=UPI000C18D34D|nr:SusC/RagA family TonB-linked outer membrane protein [Chryseobacterium sp. 52]PIF45348.1 TonB-linked SusC/RagA family outer membrane protein [Chryseobacterium sp. 52]
MIFLLNRRYPEWYGVPTYRILLGHFGNGRLFARRLHLILFILLTSAMLAVAPAVKAQNITLNVQSAPLKEVFRQIEKQSGYLFWYSDDFIKRSIPVTVSVNKMPLRAVLDKIFADQPFTYEVVGETIALKEKLLTKDIPGSQSNKKTVTGTVTDGKGEPLTGVSINLKGSVLTVVTDFKGVFSIEVPHKDAVLRFSYIGYQTYEQRVGDHDLQFNVVLKESPEMLKGVEIVSTGYQTLPKERATGSFVQINNELLNRRISTNVLDRLEGIASGVVFNRNNLPSNERMGISIRGRSTIDPLVNANPLVVLDNFPYEGDLANINPNDIESITLLKDAAAASIWGARAGNGVIVITSKKGAFNKPLKVELNTNVTIGAKPDLFYSPNFIKSADYIDAETYLFNQGFYDSDLTTNISRPMVSPVVELLAKKRANPALTNQVDAEIAGFRGLDVRNDYEKYVYRKSVNQQYALNLNGGSDHAAYHVSIGYDHNNSNLVQNTFSRLTLHSQTTFQLLKKLELTAGINYFQTKAENNTDGSAYGSFVAGAPKYGAIYPYARLADDSGNPLAVSKDFQQGYIQTMASLGFLDYKYQPLEEISLSENTKRINNLIVRGTLKYKFSDALSIQGQYQYEKQNTLDRNLQSQEMYSTRVLINRFAQRNATTGIFTYPVPLGSILALDNTDLVSNNFRTQVNYDRNFGAKHSVAAIAGAEIREVETLIYGRTSYGYNDELGTAVGNINYGTSYPINPSGNVAITAPSGAVTGRLNRLISYFANASYTYDGKYTATLSARKDGANIFGVKTNDRITPLWSAGLGWELSREGFYGLDFLPYAKLRATYGFNGNVYNASAYLTFNTTLTNTLTGLRYATVGRAPNSELSWEKVRNINLGLDFATKNNMISGTLEFYIKDGLDLIQSTPLAPSTGFTSYFGNAASNRTQGMDLSLNTKNLTGKLRWNTMFLLSYLKDKITHYDTQYTTANLISAASQFTSGTGPLLYPTVGRSLFGVYSYRWAGLDPNTGDPQGYLHGQVSKDYLGIMTNVGPDNMIYHGSSRPSVFGSVMNTFSYGNFTVSVNVIYKLGYYFRRTTTSTNLQNIFQRLTMHSDYSRRWQKSGDELTTDVPSVVYPSNTNRDAFYQGASVLVERGDHIRLQDIGLGYTFNKSQFKELPFRSLQISLYANNLGILWAENKKNLDPDSIYIYTSPNPKTISFGVKGTF